MNFEPTERAKEYVERVTAFMDEHVYPAEAVYDAADARVGRPALPAAGPRGAQGGGASARAVEPLPPAPRVGPRADESRVRAAGGDHGPQPHRAPRRCNCNAPDTGNMEVLTLFGTDEHKEK